MTATVKMKIVGAFLTFVMLVAALGVIAGIGTVEAEAVLAPTEYGGCDGNHSGYTALGGDEQAVIKSAGNYYLTSDLHESVYAASLKIEAKGTVTICLNGYNIYHEGYCVRVIDITPTKGDLTINFCDCTANGEIYHEAKKSGIDVMPSDYATTINLYGITIRDCDAGIGLDDDTTVNMYSGTIKNCEYYAFALTEENEKLNIYGGNIINNAEGIRACYSDSITLSGSPLIQNNTKGDIYFRLVCSINVNDLNVSNKLTLAQDSAAKGDFVAIKSDDPSVINNFKYINDTKALYYHDGNISIHGDTCKFLDATCITPKTCVLCGRTEGGLAEHNYSEKGFCTTVGCDSAEPPALNEDGFYEIENAGNLFWFAHQVSVEGNGEINAILLNDIDLEGRLWTPIGKTGGVNGKNYRGTFDGNWKTIRGLYVEQNTNGAGFFGEVRGGTVKNFIIYGDVVVPEGGAERIEYVGSVIASACGFDSESGAYIYGIHSYVNLTLGRHGVGRVGGLIGYANHKTVIDNCSWHGTFDLGIYRAEAGVAGFLGRIQQNSTVTVSNSAAYGTVKINYEKGSYNGYEDIFVCGFLGWSVNGENEADLTNTVIENCIFAGKIELGENTTDKIDYSAFGCLSEIKSITNCYYLSENGLPGVNNNSTYKPTEKELVAVSSAQLASGEVAYMMGGAWGQDIGTNPLPVFGEKLVYKNQIGGCNEETYVYEFSNTEKDAVTTHRWNEGEITVPPTCTTPGTKVYTCLCDSSHTKTEELGIDKEAHSVRVIWYNSKQHIRECERCFTVFETEDHSGGDGSCMPVCEICDVGYKNIDGEHKNTGDWTTDDNNANVHFRTCFDCESRLEEDHKGGEATCISKAKCEVCDVEYGEFDLNAHDIVTDPPKAPTCTDTGLTGGSHCTRCENATYPQTEIPATGHDFSMATFYMEGCEEPIEYVEYCAVCGKFDESSRRELPPNGHEWIDATCTEPKTCDLCKQTEGKALGHEWAVPDIAWCQVQATCTRCGTTEGEDVEAHTWIDATGDGTKTCSVCKITECDYIGYHDIVIDEGYAPTCTEKGLTEGQHCTRCDEMTVKQTEIPTLDHSWHAYYVEPTCTEGGGIVDFCTECGYNVRNPGDQVPALGHSYVGGVCERCGDIENVTDTEAGSETAAVTESETDDKTGSETDVADDENMGCGSSIGLGAVAIVVTAFATLLFKKKRED